MRFDQRTALFCAAGMLLGLMVGVSFADTPYPDEAGGSVCFGMEGDTGYCHSINDFPCEDEGDVGHCFYCDGTASFEEHACMATSSTTECIESGTTINCGDKYKGKCLYVFANDYCEDTHILLEAGGCGDMDVECTGTE